MENLKALVYKGDLIPYQRALAQREFEGMVGRLEIYEKVVKNNVVLPFVINWAFFPEDKPNYGDEILIYPPPEQLAKKEVLIYGRYTDLIDGTKWALLTPCL